MHKVYQERRPKSFLRRIPLAAFVAGIVIVAAMVTLSLVPGAPMPIDLIATAQSATVETGEEEVRLPPFLADEVTVVGRGRIEGAIGAETFAAAVTVTRSQISPPLTLQSLTLEAGTTVTFRKYPGVERTFEILLRPRDSDAAAPELTLFARDAFHLDAGTGATLYKPAQPHADKAPPPQAVRIAPAGGLLVLRVKVAEADKDWSVRRPFGVRAVRFFDIDEEKDGTPAIFSTIVSGSIRFEKIQTIDGRDFEITLRSGQPLHVGSISKGYLRHLRLSQAGIHAEFSGDVSELKTRWGSRERDHMPSMLAVFSSRDDMKAAGALLALLFALLQALGPGNGKS